MTLPAAIADRYIAEFLQLAKSANVYFEIVNDHLTMRAVNPHWGMWQPLRHLLDEIGATAIEGYLRRSGSASGADAAFGKMGLAGESPRSINLGAAHSG